MADSVSKIGIGLVLVGAFAFVVYLQKAEAAKVEHKAEQSRIERAARAERAEEELHAYVSNLHPGDLINLGNNCIAQITEQMNDRDTFSWDFIDLNPRKFEDLETANLMGLRMTAFGFEITGKSLVKPQLATIEAAKEYLSNPVRFEFVTVSKFDSYGGLNERLDLTVCYLTEPGEMSLREAGSFILQK
ncbi:hypothetical protein ACEWPL_015135 [Roseovarius sp. S1116L3]|uniref:hypothetical protein n=1 Tax=Roseovarius roseus TaxID=3342636 RepID=UPI003728F8B7